MCVPESLGQTQNQNVESLKKSWWEKFLVFEVWNYAGFGFF